MLPYSQLNQTASRRPAQTFFILRSQATRQGHVHLHITSTGLG